LQKSKWNGRQLLNASRLRECGTYNKPMQRQSCILLWLNRQPAGAYNAGIDLVPLPDVFATGARPAKDTSADIYMAAGALNQRRYMIPLLDLVVARFGSGNPRLDNEF